MLKMEPNASNESFSLMQHLIDEMDKSNQRIDQFTSDKQFLQGLENTMPKRPSPLEKKFDNLYDDAWKSEESDGFSLQEVASDQTSKNESGCDDVVNTAIAEVSKDYVSGVRGASISALNADSDESRVSSDTDFRLLIGKPSYARYPETATGLSDSDWNPYGTESDNNTSPRNPFHDKASDSRISEIASFNPPFNSTSLSAQTPSLFISPKQGGHMDQLQEITESSNLQAVTLRPDTTADFSSISHVSEPLISPLRKPRETLDSYHNKTLTGSHLLSQSIEAKLQNQIQEEDQGIDQDEKKFISSTSSTGYSSAASGHRDGESGRGEGFSKTTDGGTRYISVIERAKLLGIPEDILLDSKSGPPAYNDHGLETDSESKVSTSQEYDSDDLLGRKVHNLLSETAHLTKRTGLKLKKTCSSKETLDYNLLQRDLQEIQDSLHRTLGMDENVVPNRNDRRSMNMHNISADNDGDIIPSTNTTPEKETVKMAWDFADLGKLGSLSTGNGFMSEISLETKRSSSERFSHDKPSYTSDGDETRTSGSSAKLEDHAAVDLAIAEMSEQSLPKLGDMQSTVDVDQMLLSFRDQRKQLENRYQKLTNQGLADKVFRILTNQDPDSQANGILSEVSAEEREMKARLALSLHNRDFNFSSNSSRFDDSNLSYSLPDDVRKKLDLSAVSSKDSSHIFDRTSFNMPSTSKGFNAFDEAKKFLSSQMLKASERTFNHSMEIRVPQTIQCYPLFGDQRTLENEGYDKDNGSSSARISTHDSEENGVNRNGSSLLNRESNGGNGHTPSSHDNASAQTDEQEKNVSAFTAGSGVASKAKEKCRPYRPLGSREVYYTESDTASVADSVTTMESTHIGSDDASGPCLPSSVYGSRTDPPVATGIYSTRKHLLTVQEGTELPPIEENAGLDDQESERAQSQRNDPKNTELHEKSLRKDGDSSATKQNPSRQWATQDFSDRCHNVADEDLSNEGVLINVHAQYTGPEMKARSSPGIDAARRNARWANREEENRLSQFDSTKDQTSSLQQGHTRSVPYTGEDRNDLFEFQDKQPRNTQSYKLPSDAFVTTSADTQRKDTVEDIVEPLSLHIHVQRTSNKDADNSCNPSSKYDQRSRSPTEGRKGSLELRSPVESRGHHYSGADSLEGNQSLTRSLSDENLYSLSRNARISPAFRDALSPDFMSAIGSRSPLLSQDIRRSLAQPTADCPTRQEQRFDMEKRRMPYLSQTSTIRESERVPSAHENTSSKYPSSREFNQDYCDGRNRSRVDTQRRRPSSPEERALRRQQLHIDSKDRSTFKDKMNTVNPVKVGNTSESSPKRKVELTLEGMTSESDGDPDIDREPLSRRVRLLKDALTNEAEPGVSKNINALWEQFQAINDSNDSSLNSGRMEAIADLLKSPSRHFVSEYLREREEYRIERQERAQNEREKRLKEQQRLLLKSTQSTSEEELSGSYVDLLAKKEEERMKRRASKKKKGIIAEAGKPSLAVKKKMSSDNEKATDSLFSIPEDVSFEQTPSKSPSKKHKITRKPNTIDPHMLKLKEKISSQKKKIDKEMLKELQKIEKLKKLEHLLLAKKKGQISQKYLEQQLEELSSTSLLTSDLSQEDKRDHNQGSTLLSDDSTTAKDSSADMLTQKFQKSQRMKGNKIPVKDNVMQQKGRSGGEMKHLRSTSQAGLLKLVKEGYLSIDEAYNLAKDRDVLEESNTFSEISKSSSDESFFNNIRSHRFYSPYSRSDHVSKSKHVPKLKGLVPSQTFHAADQKARQHEDYQSSKRIKKAWKGDDDSQNSSVNMFDEFTGRSRSNMKRQPSSPKHMNERTSCTVAAELHKETQRRRSQSPLLHQKLSGNRRARSLSNERGNELSLFGGHKSRTSQSSSKNGRVRSLEQAHKSRSQHHDKAEYRRARSQKSENDPPGKEAPIMGGVAWHIPMDQQPARQHKQSRPLQEIKPVTANRPFERSLDENILPLTKMDYIDDNRENIWHKSNHPPGIPKLQWKEVVTRDALASKTNHYEVDPITDKVEYILNKPVAVHKEHRGTNYDMEIPLSKMSLQEAFMAKKQGFVSKCRERQKRIFLFKENHRLQEQLRLEREAIFAEQDRFAPPNLFAHPYSDNLYQPKRRVLTKQEMKELTAKKYKRLPEVIEKKEADRKGVEFKLNRLRARLFNKKVQKSVLQRSYARKR